MKNLLFGALIALFPLVGLQQTQAASLFDTEISIRPLQPGVTVESGVLGTEIYVDVNGRQIVEKAIFLTGKAAQMAVNEANAALRLAGEAARYTIDTSTQMIVVTGYIAGDLIQNFAKRGYEIGAATGEFIYDGTKAVLYETAELGAVAVAYVKLGLVSSVTYLKEGYRQATATVKYVAVESLKTANHAANVVYNGMMVAVEASKNLALQGLSGAQALAKATLVFVSDAGLFVYDATKQAVLQVGAITAQGLKIADHTVSLAFKTASKVQRMTFSAVKTIYRAIPRVGIVIEW